MAKKTTARDKYTAFHEAGHIVVGCAVGFETLAADIISDGDDIEGGTSHVPMEGTCDRPWYPLAKIMLKLAGALTEHHFFPSSDIEVWGDDEASVREELKRLRNSMFLFAPKGWATMLMSLLEALTIKIIVANLDGINAVQSLLLERRQVDGEVNEVCKMRGVHLPPDIESVLASIGYQGFPALEDASLSGQRKARVLKSRTKRVQPSLPIKVRRTILRQKYNPS
jgi:hypothetical protein